MSTRATVRSVSSIPALSVSTTSGLTQQIGFLTLLVICGMLAAGAFSLQRVKPWPRILFGALIGTFLLSAAWFDSYYSDQQFAETLVFFSLLFALFAMAPLFGVLEPRRFERLQVLDRRQDPH